MGETTTSDQAPSTVSRPRRAIPFRRRLLFIGIIVALLLVFQEFCFRLVFPLSPVPGFNRIDYTRVAAFSDAFSNAGKTGLSNVIIRIESEPDGFSFDHTLNLNGFRGPNFGVDPPPGHRRVLFIGDSFVEGFGAADGDTIPAQFMIAAGQPPVQAINLGVSGADFFEYEQLLRDGLQVLRQTDTVFMVLFFNDLPMLPFVEEVDTVVPRDFRVRNPWTPRLVEVIRLLSAGRSVPRCFYSGPFPFFGAATDSNNPLAKRRPPDGIDPDIYDAMLRGKFNPFHAGGRLAFVNLMRRDFSDNDNTQKHLQYCQSVCAARGVRLVLAYIPYHAATNPAYLEAHAKLGGPGLGDISSLNDPVFRRSQNHLRSVAQKLGIPFLDMTDEFIGAEKTVGHMFWPYDYHCNAAGYRLVAQVCARFWKDGLIPSGTSSWHSD